MPDEPITPGPHPAVDLVTDRRAILLYHRPVVGLSSALTDALSRFTRAGLVLTIVTSPRARLTLPVHALAADHVLQWVVQTPARQFYDGLSGQPLHYDGTEFIAPDPAGEPVAEFAESPPLDGGEATWQVLVSLTVEHRPTVHTQLGGAVETLSQAFAGAPPAGWGVHEPVSEPWNRAELTALARRRMPTDTRFVAVGPAPGSMIATIGATRTERGVEETVDALLTAGTTDADAAPVRVLAQQALCEIAERETVGFAWALLRPGRADLTEPARARALPMPLAVLIGPRAVRSIGRHRLETAPLPAPVAVGRPRLPALCGAVGEAAPPWEQLADLVTYLGRDTILAAAPQLAEVVEGG
jgi:hypothetical protein